MTFITKLKRAQWPTMALVSALCAAPGVASAAVTPYLGEVMAVGETFCPRGWMEANGALLPISNYTALFSLLGTTYGGDGRTTFALPDLRARIPMGTGSGPGLSPRPMGQQAGSETQTLTVSHLPSHSHAVNANNLDGDKPGPGGKLLAAAPINGTGNETIYSNEAATVTMSPSMIASTGGNQAVSIQNPYLAIRYCVAVFGVFPSRP